MARVGAYEAKTHLSQLLDRVHKGERIEITRYGVVIAILVPPGETDPVDRSSAIEELRRFREKNRLDGIPLRDLIEEGRR